MVNKLVAAAAPDVAAEKGGAWFEYATGGQTFKVKLARAGTGNPEFMRLQTKLLKPWRNTARGGVAMEIPPEKDREIQRKLYSSTVVVDWNAENFGLQFSQEACEETMREVNDFLDWVITTANEAESFRRHDIEEAAGN